MLRIYLLAIMLIFCKLSNASTADLFTYNPDEINKEMAELDILETKVLNNDISVIAQNFSFLQLEQQGKSQIPAMVPAMGKGVDDAAFILGCCLGPIGVIMVLAQHDFDSAAKALVGCVIPTGLITLGVITKDALLIELAVEIFLEVFDN